MQGLTLHGICDKNFFTQHSAQVQQSVFIVDTVSLDQERNIIQFHLSLCGKGLQRIKHAHII